MGEKESAGMSEMKQAPDKKKDEEQVDVQDNSPNAEFSARKGDAKMSVIQNIR